MREQLRNIAASVGIARRRTEEERAEALFPLRATTTAADSKRDARAARKGAASGPRCVGCRRCAWGACHVLREQAWYSLEIGCVATAGRLSVSHAGWDVHAVYVLARCCPGRTNEQTPLSSASKRGRQRIQGATSQAQRPISTARADLKLNVDDGAGHSARDARNRLHLGNHQLTELVNARCFRAHDDVVRAGYIFSQRDTLNGADRMGDLSRLADVGLNQDVCLYDHRVVPPAFRDGGAFSVSGASSVPGLETAYARRCASRYIVGECFGYAGAREVPVNLSRTARLAEIGEFPLIAAITERVSLGADVRVGPGDDAAVLAIGDAVVMSVDVLVEGVHFRRDWSEARDV